MPEPAAFADDAMLGSAFDWTNFSDEEMLATMQAIKNPTWWSNMMMPGYAMPLHFYCQINHVSA